MRIPFLLLLLYILPTLQAQKISFFTASPDSTKFTLTAEGASHLASLPMKCILQQYPNKINHTAVSDSDQVLTPIQQHPGFLWLLRLAQQCTRPLDACTAIKTVS